MGYDAVFDDTRRDAAAYYAPDTLHLHRGFAELGATAAERFWLTARAGAGYGWEEKEGRPVVEASLGLRWLPANWIEISGDVRHFRNPRYWGLRSGLSVEIRF